MLPLERSAILLTCIKRINSLETQFLVFLRVAVLHRFYYTCISKFILKTCMDNYLVGASGLKSKVCSENKSMFLPCVCEQHGPLMSGRLWVRIPRSHHTKGVKNGTSSSLAGARIKKGCARKIE